VRMVYVPTGKDEAAKEPAAGCPWSPADGERPGVHRGCADWGALRDWQCTTDAPPGAVQFQQPAHPRPELYLVEVACLLGCLGGRLPAPGPAARLCAWAGGGAFRQPDSGLPQA